MFLFCHVCIGTQDIQSQKECQALEDSDEFDKVKLSKKSRLGVKFQHVPRAVNSILSNTTFMLVTICAAADGVFIGGAEVFLPKYLETQFGLTASFAALQTGKIILITKLYRR